MMKLRGHTDNIRALLLDSTGRFVVLCIRVIFGSEVAGVVWILVKFGMKYVGS